MIERINADDIVITLPEGTTQATAEDGNKERDDRSSGWNLTGTFIFPRTEFEDPTEVWEKLRTRNFLPRVKTVTKKGTFEVCHIQVKNSTTNEFVCVPLWWLARADLLGIKRTPLESALKECKTDKERVTLLQGRAIRTSDDEIHVLDRSRWCKLVEAE